MYAELQTKHLEQHSFMSLPLSLQQQCVIKLYLAAKVILIMKMKYRHAARKHPCRI